MNTRLEIPSFKSWTGDARLNDVGVAGKAYRKSLNREFTVPLWLEARVQTIDFRRDDLFRTHLKKLSRSIQDD